MLGYNKNEKHLFEQRMQSKKGRLRQQPQTVLCSDRGEAVSNRESSCPGSHSGPFMQMRTSCLRLVGVDANEGIRYVVLMDQNRSQFIS